MVSGLGSRVNGRTRDVVKEHFEVTGEGIVHDSRKVVRQERGQHAAQALCLQSAAVFGYVLAILSGSDTCQKQFRGRFDPALHTMLVMENSFRVVRHCWGLLSR